MPKSTVKPNVHIKCLGTEREGKPIMLSLDGKDQDGKYACLDAFLTKEEALELIEKLQDGIKASK